MEEINACTEENLYSGSDLGPMGVDPFEETRIF